MKRSILATSARRLLLVGGLSACLAAPAWACDGDSPYIGSVCYMAGNYCPSGYMKADGTVLTIQQYSALYAVIGIIYGGDGRTTFALPDLRGRTVVNWGSATTATAAVPFGEKRGAESVTFDASKVPQHVHPATFTGGSGSAQASGPVSLPVTVDVPSQEVSVSGNVKIANSTASGVTTVSSNAVLAKGGGQANIYAPSSVAADTNIGPSQTFTGATTATRVSTNAAGNVTLPVTGSIAGGTVTVGANNAPATVPVSLITPRQALTACVAVEGLFPPRP